MARLDLKDDAWVDMDEHDHVIYGWLLGQPAERGSELRLTALGLPSYRHPDEAAFGRMLAGAERARSRGAACSRSAAFTSSTSPRAADRGTRSRRAQRHDVL